MRRKTLDALLTAREEKRPLALATALDGSGQWLIGSDHTEDAPESIVAEARKLLDIDQSRTVDGPDGPVFIQVHNPPWRMVVIGAVHITQPLAQMASLAGYEVTVIDPRGAFATAERFPGIDVSDDWPDEALERLAPDARTAVVTLTHDPKLDDAALDVALKSPAFYIGSLGSKKTHGARIERASEEPSLVRRYADDRRGAVDGHSAGDLSTDARRSYRRVMEEIRVGGCLLACASAHASAPRPCSMNASSAALTLSRGTSPVMDAEPIRPPLGARRASMVARMCSRTCCGEPLGRMSCRSGSE